MLEAIGRTQSTVKKGFTLLLGIIWMTAHFLPMSARISGSFSLIPDFHGMFHVVLFFQII